jgi:chromosome partitioning protein
MGNAREIVTITGYKGGVAKSTTAIHIADFLSDYGPTLIVDCDPNRTALSRYKNNLEIIKNSPKVKKLPFTVVPEKAAAMHVSDYKYIVFDTPARPDSDDLKELAEGTNLLILPTQPNSDSFEPMMKTAHDIGNAPYKFLISIVPPHPSTTGKDMRQDLIDAGLPVFEQMIRRSTGYQHAGDLSTTVRYMTGQKTLWQDYKAVGKEIISFLENNK